MLYIDNTHIIDIGNDRKCYLHPEDRSKCIKITYSGDYQQEKKEIRYYHYLIRRNVSFARVADFYGTACTSRGTGCVFELVRDYDASISRRLSYYLHTRQIDRQHLKHELENLKQYLLDQNILVRDLRLDNILYQKQNKETGRFIIIDGLGNNEFLPLCTYLKVLGRRKTVRKWNRFAHRLRRAYPDLWE